MTNQYIAISLVAVALFAGVVTASVYSYGDSGEYVWKQKKSHHFRIYYRNAPRNFVERVKTKAEDYYWNLGQQLKFMHNKWQGEIYLYDSQDDFVRLSGCGSWATGCAFRGRRIIAGYADAPEFFPRILPHELGHLVFDEFMGKTPAPRWLREGVAQYVEETRERRQFKRIIQRALYKGRLIPLSTLFSSVSYPRSKASRRIFYAESIGVVEFFVQRHPFGQHKFYSFLKELRDGKTLEKSLWWAFPYGDVSELEKRWLAWVRK